MNKMMALIEADINDTDKVDLLEAEGEPENSEPEMVVVPDDDDDHFRRVENFEDLGDAGVSENTKNVRRSHRARLKNPRYYNDEMLNATISDKDLPKLQECTQPRMATDKDVVTSVLEYVLTQYGLVKGLQKYRSKGEEAAEKEMIQIHKMDALKPIDANSLSDDERKRLLHL